MSTWVRSLAAAPSRCGSGPLGPKLLGWLTNQLDNPHWKQDKSALQNWKQNKYTTYDADTIWSASCFFTNFKRNVRFYLMQPFLWIQIPKICDLSFNWMISIRLSEVPKCEFIEILVSYIRQFNFDLQIQTYTVIPTVKSNSPPTLGNFMLFISVAHFCLLVMRNWTGCVWVCPWMKECVENNCRTSARGVLAGHLSVWTITQQEAREGRGEERKGVWGVWERERLREGKRHRDESG